MTFESTIAFLILGVMATPCLSCSRTDPEGTGDNHMAREQEVQKAYDEYKEGRDMVLEDGTIAKLGPIRNTLSDPNSDPQIPTPNSDPG